MSAAPRLFAILALGLGLARLAGAEAASAKIAPGSPKAVTAATRNDECLECHGVKGFAVPVGDTGDSRRKHLYVDADTLKDSVHGQETCVSCHTGIDRIPHDGRGEGGERSEGQNNHMLRGSLLASRPRSVDCVGCHEKRTAPPDELQTQDILAKTLAGLPPDAPVPSRVQREGGHYLDSIHAKARKDHPERVNAGCADCHGKHNVFPMPHKAAQTYRLESPNTCGACHEKALKDYTNSAHGAKLKREGKLDAAVCSDCHSAHKVASIKEDPVKLAITENCGDCHEKELKSYRDTYHGQITRLGYAHTAKCADCHGPHHILASRNPAAPTHPDNRLKTCSAECHKGATPGFVSFEPHGNTHDFERFPHLWIASKFMISLLFGVFLLFWTHSALWFRREWLDRKTGAAHLRIDHNGDPVAAQPHVRRFSWPWRLAHLILAVVVMILVLTGTTVLYADSFWAPTVMKLLGGPKVAAVLHRIAAATFGAIFFGHIAVALYRILVKEKGRFEWFGPHSLLPRRKDWHDFVGMVKWFFGQGPRPVFDRWTYWEKFDYWAPFWGMFIIGLSGLTLWFPTFFARFLPGWIFNVATLVHGEEAFLAAVFLFTVHFFNCHFRPEKLPLDVVMFTGSMTLSEFKHERPLEYRRLVEQGRLEDYLVGAPSPRMARYSRLLGFFLIAVGLILLALVLAGFIQSLF